VLRISWFETGRYSRRAKSCLSRSGESWHPDRFTHDPGLQTRAQERLKQINEAYNSLISGRAKRARSSQTSQTDGSYRARSPKYGTHPTVRWSMILTVILIFGAAFFFTSRSLLQTRQQATQDMSSIEAVQPAAHDKTNDVDTRTSRGTTSERRTETSAPDESIVSTTAAETPVVQPMSTVTVVIDPDTGLLARAECPVKGRMTFAAGTEPHGLCNVHTPETKAAAARANESRVKSVAKRITSPSKWFEGKTQDKQQIK
jgi:hypothetical protein